MDVRHGAIDFWVNSQRSGGKNSELLQRLKEDYFKGGDDFFRDLGFEEFSDAWTTPRPGLAAGPASR